MKHIITTTTFFDSALGKVVSGDSTDIIIFAKIKDVVPVRLMQDVTEREFIVAWIALRREKRR